MKEIINSERKLNLTVSIAKKVRVICGRCSGSGNIPKFKHIENGICFKCRGRNEIILHRLRIH